MTILLLLLLSHALADFPLQGDFLAKMKSPWFGNPDFCYPPIAKNELWPWCMGAHCMIHAGFVGIITSSIILGVLEFIAHGCIDLAKCRRRISFGQDQALHLACKIMWIVLVSAGL